MTRSWELISRVSSTIMILKIVIFASLFPSSMSLLWPRKPAAAVRDSAIQVGAPPEDNMSYDELASLLQNSGECNIV